MPTRGRPDLAAQAVEQFARQSYPYRELLIVDDPESPSFPNGVCGDGVSYFRQPGRQIGAKRNFACSVASGEVIVHWDDDDWSAPGRMCDQIERMLRFCTPVTGYHSMRFVEPAAGRTWQYSGSERYAIGTSLCYRKWYWERNPFPPFLPDNIGEDNLLVSGAARCIVSADAGDLLVARIHPAQTNRREALAGPSWREIL
jgi:O-antigen biosynthesis protein